MSFDVFINVHRNGGPSGVPRQRVMDAFQGHLRVEKPDFWRLEYDARNGSDLYISLDPQDPEQIIGFTVNRPCADGRLWNALFAIMQLGPVVLYFPGCHAALVASLDTVPHLPADMIDALGGVKCVHGGREIQEDIRAS